MNESPRWLLSKGRVHDAHKIVFGKKLDENDLEYLEQRSDSKKEILPDRQTGEVICICVDNNLYILLII